MTLSPALAELAFAAGAGDRVVGVSSHSDYPPRAAALPVVAGAARVDVERVLALRPDLALAWPGGNPAADLAALRRAGVRVATIGVDGPDDVPRALRRVGALAGTAATAERAAAHLEAGLNRLRRENAGKPALKVFYQVWPRPLMTVRGEHFISRTIALCGGRTLFADTTAVTPTVSVEALAAARPDVILGPGADAALRAQWAPYGWLPAVRAGRVYGVQPDWVSRPGPRLLDAAREICRALDAARASIADTR